MPTEQSFSGQTIHRARDSFNVKGVVVAEPCANDGGDLCKRLERHSGSFVAVAFVRASTCREH